MNIAYLERQLRLGKHPTQLGAEEIGKGAQKTAYRILTCQNPETYIVIKERQIGWRDGSPKAPQGIRDYGARQARQYKVKGWTLQEAVTVLRDRHTMQWNCNTEVRRQWRELYRADLGDLHEYNCGIDSDGKLVVFDW